MAIPGSAGPFLLAQLEEEGGYEIERSLRFNSSDSAYLSRTPASSSNRKTWTWAGWVKRSKSDSFNSEIFGAGSNNFGFTFIGDVVNIYEANGSILWNRASTAVYRDFSAWYHFTIAYDTTQLTEANRVKIYVNGIEITAFLVNTSPSLNYDGYVNSAIPHYIGLQTVSNRYLNGYLADIHFIDGQALDPSSFTVNSMTNNVLATQGIRMPAPTAPTASRLPFSNNSTAAALGTDTSGNGNTWTVNNISVTAGAGNDSLVDSPTNYGEDTGAGGEVRGNYATFNPLDRPTAGTLTITNGNLDALVQTGSGAYPSARLTITPAQISGKYQWEVAIGSKTASFWQMGLNLSALAYSAADQHATFRSDGFYSSSLPGSWSGTPPSFTQGDVITVAYDADAGTCKFYKNGALGPTFTLSSIPQNLNFGVWADSSGGNANYTLNAGQRPFAYPVSGFKALCTTNLPEPTIAAGSTAMDVKLYTGNGSTQTISGLNFDPDLVWIKGRSGATDHALYDTVRTATKQLESNTTTAETTEATGLTAFATGGFSLGALAQVNTSSATFAAWTWDAGSINSHQHTRQHHFSGEGEC
jgi:hypothetical protein